MSVWGSRPVPIRMAFNNAEKRGPFHRKGVYGVGGEILLHFLSEELANRH